MDIIYKNLYVFIMSENNQLTMFDFTAFQKLAQIHQEGQRPNEAHFDLGNGKRLSLWFNFYVDPDMAALGQLFGFHKKTETGLDFMARNYESADFTMRMYADVHNQIFTEIRKHVNKERGKAELSVKNYLQSNPEKASIIGLVIK